MILTISSSACVNSSNDGYKGDLIPIRAEVENIAGYEKMVQLIIKNDSRIKDEIKNPKKYDKRTYKDFKSFKNRESSILDSLSKLEDILKLRFNGVYNGLKIDGKDTTITFNPSAGDFSMRNNWTDKDAGYTLFEHYIIYSTKPIKVFKNENNEDDTPSAVYKIKDRYYYAIYSRLEY